MKFKRTIACILLIAASALPLFFSAFFIGGRVLIRHIMLERLEKENVQTLYIPAAEFKWFKKDREILVNGKMFDVKSVNLTGNVYTVKGIFDDLETELNTKLEKSAENKNAANNNNVIYQVCLGLIAEKPFTSFPDFAIRKIITRKKNAEAHQPLCWTYLQHFSPPPERVL
jgi:hypothetical protein